MDDTYTNDTSTRDVSLNDLRKVKRKMDEVAPTRNDAPTDLVMTYKVYDEITSQMAKKSRYYVVNDVRAPMYNGMGLHKADTGKAMWAMLRQLVVSGRKPAVLDSGEPWINSAKALFNAYMLTHMGNVEAIPKWQDLEEFSRQYIEAQEGIA